MSSIKEAYSILYVEDEKDIRENYVNYLKRHFQNVYEACDGEEGLELYRNKKPDIMIVDINLPKLNGLDLLKIIREDDHSTKVIMLTAHSDTRYLLEATELKLTKYLIKPISRSELKDALNIVVSELLKFNVLSKKIINLPDGYYWDCIALELLNKNSSVLLTNKERELLKILFSNINMVHTYGNIIINIWYENSYNADKLDSLKTIIKNLRKKLPKDIIKNIFSVGYKINLN